jgi:hypothetical protein
MLFSTMWSGVHTALVSVRHFRVKLDTVVTACVIRHAGNRCAVGTGNHLETIRQLHDAIAMTHPYIEQAVAILGGMVLDVLEQAGMSARAYLRIAVFMVIGVFHLAAELCHHALHAVADTEHRHATGKYDIRYPRGLYSRDGLGPAGHDNSARGKFLNVFRLDVPGQYLAIDAQFAHATCNQLGVLGTEIQDQDPVGVDIFSH